jgi:hypothetical protein
LSREAALTEEAAGVPQRDPLAARTVVPFVAPLSRRHERGYANRCRVAGLPAREGIDGVDLDEALPFPEGSRRDVGLVLGGLIERLDLDHLNTAIRQFGHEVVQQCRADAVAPFGAFNRDPKDLRGARRAASDHREANDTLRPNGYPARMGVQVALHLRRHVVGEVVGQTLDYRDAGLGVSSRGAANCHHRPIVAGSRRSGIPSGLLLRNGALGADQ